MVRVIIKRDYIKTPFEFKDFSVAAKFINLALNAVTEEIKVEIEKLEEPQEESRFTNPDELEEVPVEELANTEVFF